MPRADPPSATSSLMLPFVPRNPPPAARRPRWLKSRDVLFWLTLELLSIVFMKELPDSEEAMDATVKMVMGRLGRGGTGIWSVSMPMHWRIDGRRLTWVWMHSRATCGNRRIQITTRTYCQQN
jgi:hypothetical protein